MDNVYLYPVAAAMRHRIHLNYSPINDTVMKSVFYHTRFSLLFFLLLLNTSCLKEDEVMPDDKPQKDESLPVDLPVSEGSVGVMIDTRSIVKNGYTPQSVQINFEGPLSAYSKELPVDEFTNLAIIEIPRDSLSTEELNLFSKGVKVDIVVKDEKDQILSHTTEKSLAFSNATLVYPVNTDLPKVQPPLKLNPDSYYIIQEAGGLTDSLVLDIPYEDMGSVFVTLYNYNGEDFNNQFFYFVPAQEGNDSTYYIRAKHSGNYLGLHNGMLYQVPAKNIDQLNSLFKFILSYGADGWITIKSFEGIPLKLNKEMLAYKKPGDLFGIPQQWNVLSTKEGGEAISFRLVAAEVTWFATDLGTEFNKPILSPAKMDFAVNEVLENCSSARVEKVVGKDDERTSSYASISEESFEISTTHSATVGIKASYTASATFYGVGVQTNLEASATYAYTKSLSQLHSKSIKIEDSNTVRVSWGRKVEVPPYAAVHVYDVVQTINDVKIPFVQKIRLEAELKGKKLLGKEIVQQLMSNQFGGVVTEIGDKHVVITVRGFSHIDKLMESRTILNDIENACN